MNKILAKVLSIENNDILNIITFDFNVNKISMLSLEVEYLHVNDRVVVLKSML